MGISIYITDFDAANTDLDNENSIDLRQHKTYIVLGIMCFATVLILIFSIIVKEDLNRVNYKKQVSKTNAIDEKDSPNSNEKEGYKQPQPEFLESK